MNRYTNKSQVKSQYKTGYSMLPFVLLLLYILPVTLPARDSSLHRHDKSNFPLVGKHRTVVCSECHHKGVMKGTPTDCEACHWHRQQDDHYQLQLGLHCGDCHTPRDWKFIKPGAWSHEETSGYRLEGAHKLVDCYHCHTGNHFASGMKECIDCHRDDYMKVSEPNHQLGGFPTDCLQCHNVTSWQTVTNLHVSFPLQGMHRTASCQQCHSNSNYLGTSPECVSCHLTDYNGTTNPNHRKAGYPVGCEVCHGSQAMGWQGAHWGDHNQFWVLKGPHRGLDCNSCHWQSYSITKACVNCHLDAYNDTTEPNHANAGFHTDCEVCHLDGVSSWSQTQFDHQFPIFSGKHQPVSCTDCHISGNYYEFSCLDCHAHEKNRMVQKHNGIGGYVYESRACFSCHPGGTK